MSNSGNIANHFFEMTELLRGCYKVSSYFRVILPLLLLRRLDCVLEQTREAVLAAHQQLSPTLTGDALDAALNDIAGQPFHNHFPLNLQGIRSVPREVHLNLPGYIGSFSGNVRAFFEQLGFNEQIAKLHKDNLLFLVIRKLCEIDLDPAVVSNREMEEVSDEIFWRFSDWYSEELGEHATPPDVARLVVSLLFAPDAGRLAIPGKGYTLFDPACGIGGMLLEARKHLRQHQPGANLILNGQDINPEAWATTAARLLLGNDAKFFGVKLGDSLADDQFKDQHFDYLCANPPWGLGWQRIQKQITQESEQQGFAGRFGAGLPRVSDSSLLFLQHMLAKFEPVSEDDAQTGSRMAIVFNASPLFSGTAGSGESEIRKWIIENDWLETIVALPPALFYNTGIGTYIWLLTNRKAPERRGKIQLIDARARVDALPRSIGNKRMGFSERQIADIMHDYTAMAVGASSKVVNNTDFGYRRVTIERPLRLTCYFTVERKDTFLNACPELLDDMRAIEQAIGREEQPDWNDVWQRVVNILQQRNSKWRMPQVRVFRDVFTAINQAGCPVLLKAGNMGTDTSAKYEADPRLRDSENVPLNQDVSAWFEREVLPWAADAWIDHSKTQIGYEINFNHYFLSTQLPKRNLAEIDADLNQIGKKIVRLLQEVTA